MCHRLGNSNPRNRGILPSLPILRRQKIGDDAQPRESTGSPAQNMPPKGPSPRGIAKECLRGKLITVEKSSVLVSRT